MVGVAAFGGCRVGILWVRLLHTTTLTSVPCGGRGPNRDPAPSTFFPSNRGRFCSAI